MPRGGRFPGGKAPSESEKSDEDFDERQMPMAMREVIAKRLKPQEYARFFMKNLPGDKQRAVKGLQGVQLDIDNLIHEQMLAVEDIYRKFYTKLLPLYARRADIVSGASAPTDAELEKAFPDDREGAQAPADEDDKEKTEKSEEDAGSDPTELRKHLARERAEKISEGPGIPRFWLETLRNHEILEARITERDEEVLAHLVDVDYIYLSPPRLGFAIRFVFGSNDFIETATPVRKGMQKVEHNSGPCVPCEAAGKRQFEAGPVPLEELTAGLKIPEGGTVLFKTYYLESDMDGDPILVTVDGTDITWKAGNNPTVQIRKKKQVRGGKGKGPKQTRIRNVEEPVMSFFNFFKEVSDSDDLEDDDEDGESAIDRDFEIARLLRSSLIPRAVEWFTARALEPESLGIEDGDEEDEEGDEEDEAPLGKGAKPAGKDVKPAGQKTPGFGAPGGKDKEECKQQ